MGKINFTKLIGAAKFLLGDGAQLDSFSRLRVSDPITIYDNQFEYDIRENEWDTQITGAIVVMTGVVGTFQVGETITGGTSLATGTVTVEAGSTLTYNTTRKLFEVGEVITGGTSGATGTISTLNTGPWYSHLPNESSVDLLPTTASGDKIIRTTRQYLRYQPGKAHMIYMTLILKAKETNVTKRIGYFDEENGIFIEQDGSDLKFVRRTFTSGSTVNNVVNQSEWNIDKMDGTGPSGIILDETKTQIMIIDLQWLGAGRVRFGFDIDGMIFYCHEIMNANNLGIVYTTTMNLPLRYEIENTGVPATASSLKQMCQSAISEGGETELDKLGHVFHAGLENTPVTAASGVATPIIAIRLKTSFKGKVNRGKVFLKELTSYNTKAIHATVITNPVIVGGAWISADPNSLVEFNITATGFSGGTVISGFYADVKSQIAVIPKSRNPFTIDSYGSESDILLLTAAGIAGAASTYAGLSWEEIF